MLESQLFPGYLFSIYEMGFTDIIPIFHLDPFKQKARCSIVNLLLTKALMFTLKVIICSCNYIFIIAFISSFKHFSFKRMYTETMPRNQISFPLRHVYL